MFPYFRTTLLLAFFLLGSIFVAAQTSSESSLVAPPVFSGYRDWNGIDRTGMPWMHNLSRRYRLKGGLADRHLFIWASHGRYFDGVKWKWQRPVLFCTTEDLLTQSFVYPFLIPMLENAGAIVYTPRERDPQPHEAIVDNDTPGTDGNYTERNVENKIWLSVGTPGFLRPKDTLTDNDMPFRQGTARFVETTSVSEGRSTATWTPLIKKSGKYAVYVSYAAHPLNVEDAHYTVYHAGGKTEFLVNQRMGAGTWLYLGTFLFNEGQKESGRVVLDNSSRQRGIVTADAVRFGGGMGIMARSLAQIQYAPDSTRTLIYGDGKTSGLRRQLEAARYYAQWAGLPDTLYRSLDEPSDYNSDIRARSHLLNYLGGGSVFMPDTVGARVPFELSLALHTDAGFNPDGSVFGTLGIATTHDERGDSLYRTGMAREVSLDFAREVMASLHRDLSQEFHVPWNLRELYDRNYGETRMPLVPSIILELLAHQSYTDMKYAHDPNFKFAVARSIYKAMVRYVARMHRKPDPVIQPLPVRAFAAQLQKGQNAVRLSWLPTTDSLEVSARPTDYVVYTRTPETDFDNGRMSHGKTNLTIPVEPGKQYIFRVAAVNAGGESFPSPSLSVYCSRSHRSGLAPEILVVDGFARLSGPAWIESTDSVGFDLNADFGVPYDYTTAFCGAQKRFSRADLGKEGTESLGYGGSELMGQLFVGNRFDSSVSHVQAIAHAWEAVSVSAMTKEAFEAGNSVLFKNYRLIDYACGLEKNAPYHLRLYEAVSRQSQSLLRNYVEGGGSLLLSGSFIGSDTQDPNGRRFLGEVLHAKSPGSVRNDSLSTFTGFGLPLAVYNLPNADHFSCTTTDILEPVDGAFAICSYGKGGYGAGVAYGGNRNRSIVLGFPFECIISSKVRAQTMRAMLRFLILR